jgi:hypothetical protein
MNDPGYLVLDLFTQEGLLIDWTQSLGNLLLPLFAGEGDSSLCKREVRKDSTKNSLITGPSMCLGILTD